MFRLKKRFNDFIERNYIELFFSTLNAPRWNMETKYVLSITLVYFVCSCTHSAKCINLKKIVCNKFVCRM